MSAQYDFLKNGTVFSLEKFKKKQEHNPANKKSVEKTDGALLHHCVQSLSHLTEKNRRFGEIRKRSAQRQLILINSYFP